MASNPTFVLVPGAWLKPEIYSNVVKHLSTYGYASISLPLASAGSNPPHADFNGDVAAIRNCLTKLVLENTDVVLVVHSYSGFPGGEAAKGLAKKDRDAQGLKGGIIRYVVINGFATPPGFSTNYRKNGVVNVEAEDAKRIFFNDLTSYQGDEQVAQLMPQSLGVYSSTATYAAWIDIPSTFLQGDKDQSVFNTAMNDMMIKGAQQLNPSPFDVIDYCPEGGHCLMISYPEWTAEALVRAAGGKA